MISRYLFMVLVFYSLSACGQTTSTENTKEPVELIHQTKESKLKIEIWSDVLCPFCYIGKRNFEMALAQFPYKDKIEVVWKSYQLAPNDKPSRVKIPMSIWLKNWGSA